MEEIKSISAYRDAYTLIDENCYKLIDGISEDVKEELQHVDDFEPYTYYIVNDKAVILCDSISGDKYTSYETIEEFTYR